MPTGCDGGRSSSIWRGSSSSQAESAASTAAGSKSAKNAMRQPCRDSAAAASSGPATMPQASPEAKNLIPVKRRGEGGMWFTSTRPAVMKDEQPSAIKARPRAN